MFCLVMVSAYAASIVWPWAAGERIWMWVDTIVFPCIVLIAFSVILGDRTPDGSTEFRGSF